MDFRPLRCQNLDAHTVEYSHSIRLPSNLLNTIESLLKSSETVQLCESLEQRSLETDAIHPWHTPLHQPPVSNKKVKRKRNERALYDSKRADLEYSSGLWSGSVEKHSYRYVVNNACYRNMKAWSNAQKKFYGASRPTAASTGLPVDKKILQKELTRDLKKELGHALNETPYFFSIDDTVISCDNTLKESNSLDARENSTDIGENFIDTHENSTENGKSSIDTRENSTGVVESSIDVRRSSPDILENSGSLQTEFEINRISESKSAQPLSDSTEEVLVEPRSSSMVGGSSGKHLDTPNKEVGRRKSNSLYETKLVRGKTKLLFSLDRAHRSSISHLSRSDEVSQLQVAALANETFKKSEKTLESPRTLKPVEKITPALREAHENARAAQELLRLNQVPKTICKEINTRSIFPVNSTKQQDIRWVSSTAPDNQKTTSIRLAVNSIHPNYKISEIGENKSKPPLPPKIIVESNESNHDLTAFLPVISGKSITARLDSFR